MVILNDITVKVFGFFSQETYEKFDFQTFYVRIPDISVFK